jgi:hypothetical protein
MMKQNKEYRAGCKWRAINHKHTIFNERIFDNDFTRVNIVGTIRRKGEARARYYDSIKAAIDGIRLVKRRISQVANAINKQHKLFISRIREFREVARRYVLGCIPEDTRIKASRINRIKGKKIEGVGVYDDMEPKNGLILTYHPCDITCRYHMLNFRRI